VAATIFCRRGRQQPEQQKAKVNQVMVPSNGTARFSAFEMLELLFFGG